MAKVYEIDGVIPVIDPSAYVHPDAVLIGDVIVGPECYIGPCASLRGDFGRIVVGRAANVQDTCVLHSFPGKELIIEDEGHIGHGAVLHGCIVKRNALVGINAVVMDGAIIGEDAFVAGAAFVKAGFQVPPRTLAAGVPAKIIKQLSEQDVAWKSNGTRVYRELAVRCQQTLRPAQSLSAVEPNRPRVNCSEDEATPKHVLPGKPE